MTLKKIVFSITALLIIEQSSAFLIFNISDIPKHFNNTLSHGNFDDRGFSNREPANTEPMSDYWDWRDKKMVSPVKDQGSCAACWAFSVVANIESHLAIYLKREELLSEQFLLDCDLSIEDVCSSGSILKSFATIVSSFGGVLRESDYYDYVERRQKCRWFGKPLPVPVVGFRRVESDEEVMTKYIYKYGPLSAAINSASMKKVKANDVYIDEPTEEDCPADQLDHSILIVGYNVYAGHRGLVPYWIIKNSWGTNWGDNGYYYLVRGRNACGISKDVSFAYVN